MLIAPAFLLVSCSTSPSPAYERNMGKLKATVKIGSDIHRAKKNLERQGFETSDVYDPTKLGEVLWMNVDFGIYPGLLDGVSYAAGNSDADAPISGLVEATPDGKVTSIR